MPEQWSRRSKPPTRRTFTENKGVLAAVVTKEGVSTSIGQLSQDFTLVTEAFERCKATGRTVSKMFAFWEKYLAMMNILVQFIKAEQTADWSLHLTTVAAKLPYFFAMDRQNYARWLPIYLADMNSLAAAHPRVYENSCLVAMHSCLDRHGPRVIDQCLL